MSEMVQIGDREWIERGRMIGEMGVRVGHLETAVDKLSLAVEKQGDRLEASISSAYTRLEAQMTIDRAKQDKTSQKVNLAFSVLSVLVIIANIVSSMVVPLFRAAK